MKSWRLEAWFVVLGIAIVVSLSPLTVGWTSEPSVAGASREISKEAQDVLNRLNDWHKEECDVHERPQLYPNRKPSGETNGWINSNKQELGKLGVSVRWNPDKKRYEVLKHPTDATRPETSQKKSEPAPRESLYQLALADESNLSMATMVWSYKKKQNAEVRLVLNPKGTGGKGKHRAIWGIKLTTVDYSPDTVNYYAVVKETDGQVFVFCLWNRQHCTVEVKSGKIISQGQGEDALKAHNRLELLKLHVYVPATGREMTAEERKQLEREEQELDSQNPK